MNKFIVIATIALCMFLSTAISAQVLKNGSFEQGIAEDGFNQWGFRTVSNDTDISFWSIDAYSVDYVTDYWTASEGLRSVDLNGTAYLADGNVNLAGIVTGQIAQTLATIPNRTYTLTFDLSGNPDGGPSNKTMTVWTTGDTQDYSFNVATIGNNHDDMKWATQTFTFKATAPSTVLTFASTTEGPWGPVIDNVVISGVTGQICHVNSGNKGPKTLTVGSPAIPAHLAHGDREGPCELVQ